MFEDYKKKVFSTYERMREEGTLSLVLSHPTSAKLREECIRVYDERYNSNDQSILTTFFSSFNSENDHRQIIANTDPDEFKPLVNFLKRKTGKTDNKNIELLAWLINFHPRPSTLFYKSIKTNTAAQNHLSTNIPSEEKGPLEINISNFISSSSDGSENDISDRHKGSTNSDESLIPRKIFDYGAKEKAIYSSKSFLVFGAFLLLVGIGTYFLWKQHHNASRNPLVDERCMVWTGDHYEPVNCDEKVENKLKLPLQFLKLEGFRKIESPDTLTKSSLGKVWYSNIAGKHEFFTDSGKHPVDTIRRLRPLTKYILANHVSYYRYLFRNLVWSTLPLIIILIAFIFNYVRNKK
jgi:hypothetical protein